MNTDRDAESVSRDSLKGDMVEFPGNSLSTLNTNMMMTMVVLMMIVRRIMMI